MRILKCKLLMATIRVILSIVLYLQSLREQKILQSRCFIFVILLFCPLLCQAYLIESKNKGINEITGLQQKETLEIEKLKQEVIKLQTENENIKSPWMKISSNAASIMAIVALIGVFVTIWKQLIDNKRGRELDRKQRDLDRDQRERENQRWIDQKFTSTLNNLGSASEAIQASAIVSMVTFLKPEYKETHEQVFDILLANLKIQHSDAVSQLLVTAFEKALRRKFDHIKETNGIIELDLSRSNLKQVNLSGLDLTNADLGFAQMRLANLTGAILFRVRGYETNLEKARLSKSNLSEARLQKARLGGAYLHECNLVAADLKHADLRGAEFYQSKMQAAHLEGANIIGASFEQADVNDTYFNRIITDDHALRSLSKSRNWRNAHFDEEHKLKLEELAHMLPKENL